MSELVLLAGFPGVLYGEGVTTMMLRNPSENMIVPLTPPYSEPYRSKSAQLAIRWSLCRAP